MAAKKKTRVNKTAKQTPETTLRHVWLAGLGLVAVARREVINAANQTAARVDALKQQAGKLADEAQDNVRSGIASVREQGEARVVQFSAEVEARLQPVLAKLGVKPQAKAKPAKRGRKATKQAKPAARRPATARRKMASKRVVRKRA